MHSNLFYLSLLATTSLAAPAPKHVKRSFSQLMKRNPNFVAHGPAALRKAYVKFGFDHSNLETNSIEQMPNIMGTGPSTEPMMDNTLASTQGAGAGGQTGADPSTVANMGSEFLSPVIVGGQELMMDFDTGSSDLWVFNTQTPTQESTGHTLFNPQQSKTFAVLQGATWNISYGDGSGAAGNVGTDTVNIGGATATKQAVELATSVTQTFAQDTQNDGLVGLAFPILNTVKPQQQNTFFANVMPTLDMPVFTANLQTGNGGQFDFGKIDATQFEGNMAWTPVNASSGFWQFTSDQFAINGKPQQNPAATPAIADSGTSLLLVDPPVAQAYYAQVPGAQNDQAAGGFIYPCSAALPDFSVMINPQYMATVPGNQVTFASAGQGQCFGGIQSNMGAPMQIYGDTLFKTQVIAFNGGNQSLGFAPKVGQPPAPGAAGVAKDATSSASLSRSLETRTTMGLLSLASLSTVVGAVMSV